MKGNKSYLGLESPNKKFRPFNRTSFWNQKIADKPKIDPLNIYQIGALREKAKVLKTNIKNWTIPVHYIDSRFAKRVQVLNSKSEPFHESVDPKQVGWVINVPIPDQCWSDPKDDAHMCLVDTHRLTAYDFSRFNRGILDTVVKCTTHNQWDLSSTGEREPFSGKTWWKNGSRGSGAPLIAGLILIGELETKKIKHKIACALPTTMKDYLRKPATRTDGAVAESFGIPMGSVIRLKPDFDDSALNEETRILTKAMKLYGLVVVDTSSDFTIYFQNLGQDKGKWAKYDFQVSKIPVDQFEVLGGERVKRWGKEFLNF